MEGVLIPEVWPHISEKTKIKELSITSRDIPDYESLVLKRIEILRENNLKLKDIVSLISELEPLEGAIGFLDRLKKSYKVILVSDAFEQTITPLWEKLEKPELQCHQFKCDAEGYITAPIYSRNRGKVEVIEALFAQPNTIILSESCSESACSSASVEVFTSTKIAEMTSSIGYAKASNTDAGDYFGYSVSLSSDGNTLAVGAQYEESNATGIGGDEDDSSTSDAGAVYLY